MLVLTQESHFTSIYKPSTSKTQHRMFSTGLCQISVTRSCITCVSRWPNRCTHYAPCKREVTNEFSLFKTDGGRCTQGLTRQLCQRGPDWWAMYFTIELTYIQWKKVQLWKKSAMFFFCVQPALKMHSWFQESLLYQICIHVLKGHGQV